MNSVVNIFWGRVAESPASLSIGSGTPLLIRESINMLKIIHVFKSFLPLVESNGGPLLHVQRKICKILRSDASETFCKLKKIPNSKPE